MHQWKHTQFVDKNDKPQNAYEKARKAAMDNRYKIGKCFFSSIKVHGVAGLFIGPESVIATLSPNISRISPRKNTALFKAHLSEQAFETIAKSLAEGVGVSSTARIQNVNKQTVLLA